jgi:hypothetical protein
MRMQSTYCNPQVSVSHRSVLTIGPESFAYCSSLTSVTISWWGARIYCCTLDILVSASVSFAIFYLLLLRTLYLNRGSAFNHSDNVVFHIYGYPSANPTTAPTALTTKPTTTLTAKPTAPTAKPTAPTAKISAKPTFAEQPPGDVFSAPTGQPISAKLTFAEQPPGDVSGLRTWHRGSQGVQVSGREPLHHILPTANPTIVPSIVPPCALTLWV